MNYAILLSGGMGNRINSDVPKQYIRVGGCMMITSALKRLIACAHIDRIVIVAEESWRGRIDDDCDGVGLAMDKVTGYADPGANRQLSIYNGMRAVMKNVIADGVNGMGDDDTVLVHDAARPFITAKLLDRCYAALPGHDGVMPVLPMKDTVYLSRDGTEVSQLLDRSEIFAGQAPELFRFVDYYKAVEGLLPNDIMDINGATEPAVMYGMNIAMIPGDETNYKVTTDADLERYREAMGK